MITRLAAGALALAVVAPSAAGSTAGGATGGAARSDCTPQRGTTSIGESWAQRRLNLPEVWRLTKGVGVTVAIVDSGVDTRHPQLKVASSVDLTGTHDYDCVGHGTAVAGIIAGTEIRGVPFTGVAPRAKLISIKQTNESNGDVGKLAQGIVRAVELGADVINVSIQAADQPDLKAAVDYALAQDVVVVAAAGNVQRADGSAAPAYPAAYPGVLSVGSAGPEGGRAGSSNASTPVSVLAPGTAVTAPWPGRAYREDLEGTSFAAPYVAGVAALVRARHPGLDQVRVRRRIELTADGASGSGTGAGMVNPLLAVSAILPETVAIAPQDPAPLPPGAVRPAPAEDVQGMAIAGRVALFSLSAAVLAVLAGVVVPLGRRRGWRPGGRRPAAPSGGPRRALL
ncbi:S8 family serine peptidase [Planomonospora sp. ID82291]|uniref:S8 family serine peptidase n=1 Tax=Planomonospora sp. ID82291 TaxID=2738136 RepID=UPI0018C39AD0|nr:S8 family serine peptidase [Planomonospora sp. ID82291]MBG0815344.1 S8 family serine peptidase [Planomonospora sp. ID82291]